MAEDFYSKKAIGDRVRERLNPPQADGGSVIERLKEVARRRRGQPLVTR
ncbi:hypothetical protein LCGC14_1594470 [marine sediment metagenome]|uniref:Uncharacterized protein n=1 Tax=marine sediment metagenome TaxID=412755 RepID=A0A0F9ID21_9ZZZZ